jgi:hypothetical protein
MDRKDPPLVSYLFPGATTTESASREPQSELLVATCGCGSSRGDPVELLGVMRGDEVPPMIAAGHRGHCRLQPLRREIFRVELEEAIALAGCATIADINRTMVEVDPR